MIDRGDTVFHLTRMVNLTTEDGFIQINNNTLTINKNGVETKRDFPEEEFPELLRKYYGIEYRK